MFFRRREGRELKFWGYRGGVERGDFGRCCWEWEGVERGREKIEE